MSTLKDITNAYWSLSLSGNGEIVQGVDAINQCIKIIFDTRVGSDPLRPTFGCELWKEIDRPMNIAIPNVIKMMADSLAKWEPRIVLTNIAYKIDTEILSKVTFSVTYKLVTKKGAGTVPYSVTPYPQTSSTNLGFDYVLNFQL